MNPFKSYTLTWWQVGLLKVSMLALGLVVGATWPEAFATWTVLLWILFAIPAAYLTFVGFRLMVHISCLVIWSQGYLRGVLSFVFTLSILWIAALLLGYKIEVIDTFEFYLARFVAVTKPVRVTLGSCYPFQYGLDLDNRTMHFYPIPTDKAIKFPGAGRTFRLDLALQNEEKLLTLERGRLGLTFPPRTIMTDEYGELLSDMKKKRSPWICLGTGSTSCYVDFSYINPGFPQCLYPIFLKFPENMRGKTVTIVHTVNAKDQQPNVGKVLMKVE